MQKVFGLDTTGQRRTERISSWLAALSFVIGVCWPLAAGAQATGGHAFRPIRVTGGRPPITHFPVKPVGQAADELNPAELVLGVVLNNQARAYPINMLTGPSREILNDTLADTPIAATW